MANEFLWYCPRKSPSRPRISAKPAVTRQCWPTAWDHAGFTYIPAPFWRTTVSISKLRFVSIVYAARPTSERERPRSGE